MGCKGFLIKKKGLTTQVKKKPKGMQWARNQEENTYNPSGEKAKRDVR
jgi:hypothetical protein